MGDRLGGELTLAHDLADIVDPLRVFKKSKSGVNGDQTVEVLEASRAWPVDRVEWQVGSRGSNHVAEIVHTVSRAISDCRVGVERSQILHLP